MGFFDRNKVLVEELAVAEQQCRATECLVKAFSTSMAMIEFTPTGEVLCANDNFLKTMEYNEQQILGKHHSMFCQSSLLNSQEYTEFWRKLAAGESFNGEFQRITRTGKLIWLAASYCPVINEMGKVEKIVKIASDVTDTVSTMQQLKSQSEAVSLSMAVIEFDLNGNILSCNENFQKTMGYSAAELKGQHHRIFCTNEFANSSEYKKMWQQLNNGEFLSGRYERVNKQKEPVWLEATYNPIFDSDGTLIKVMKFATNITDTIEVSKKTSQVAYESLMNTDDMSQKGLGVVNEAIESMSQVSEGLGSAAESIDSLSKQSDQISNIVDTITAIADQTNLLALNAAIEAARAGEQGRGFAVVADEVRQLAGRTSKSTAEIDGVVRENNLLACQAVKSMEEIVSRSKEGMELVEQTGEVINEISSGTRQIVEVVKQQLTGM